MSAPPIPPIVLDRQQGTVTILQTRLRLRCDAGPLVPRLASFSHLTLDQRMVEGLEKVAIAAHLGEPCLLEGETSTSKTTSIEYLAALTETPLVRMNLSGQTDTSELIGKFVPNDGQLQISFDELLRQVSSLSDASRAIVERAHTEGRGLSLLDASRVATAEGLGVPEWRWQNGVIPEAMQKGRWVILDELNLGEPQVLERLNPVIERHPSLTLTEQWWRAHCGGGGNPATRRLPDLRDDESVGLVEKLVPIEDRRLRAHIERQQG